MNERDIIKQLRTNFADPFLFTKLKYHNAVIAGGALTSTVTGKRINDFDIYFKRIEDVEIIENYLKDNDYEFISATENAITYKRVSDYTRFKIVVQLIRAKDLIVESPKELISKFDFTINMAAYDLKHDTLYMHDDFINHNMKRELVFNEDTKYPIISLHRAIKYISRGYKLDGYEQVKIGLAINNLHMKNYLDLKRQLQGIDTSQFQSLTDKLMEDPDREYNYEEISNEINNLDKDSTLFI